MGQFISQKPPNLRGIFSIDIEIEDGEKRAAQIGLGTSLRQVTTSAVILQIEDQPVKKHWRVVVDTLKVSFEKILSARC